MTTKNCPCCNGPAYIMKGYASEPIWKHGDFFRVYCGSCQLRQLFYRTDDEAIAAWNRREQVSAADAERFKWIADRVKIDISGTGYRSWYDLDVTVIRHNDFTHGGHIKFKHDTFRDAIDAAMAKGVQA